MLKNNLDIEENIIKNICYEEDIFLEKRKIGENDTLLCKIIQRDLIDEFIIYINKEKIPISSRIMTSIFETNSFLLENCPTLLEYSAFYGSVQIFRYLINKGAKFTPSLLNFSIHGQNHEIIEKTMNNQNNTFKSYISCLIESIKCHCCGLTQFIFDSYLKKSIENIKAFDESFNKHCLKYYNYACLRKMLNHSFVNLIKKHQEQNDSYIDVSNDTIEQENSLNERFILYNFIENLFNIVKILQEKVNVQSDIITSVTEENVCLKNQNKCLRLQNSILKKRIKKAVNQNNLLIGKLAKKNSKINELKNQLKNLAKEEYYSNDDVEFGPENLTTSIIFEIIKKSKINVYCRRYSKTLKDICFMLYINSNVTYNLLRKFLPLPNPDNLRKEYKDTVKNKEENLLNQNQIKYLLEELRNEMAKDENEPIVAAIAFDAATIDPRDQGSNGLFVFNFQPLDGSKRTRIVNVETRDNGKADDGILERAREIQKIGEELNIIIRFVASDSDSKTNKLHTNFKNYLDKFQGSSFDQLIIYIDSYTEMIPISDWLHLCKNLRSRFISQKIILFKGSQIIDPEIICQKLQLNPKVLYATGRESMRDDIALKLLNFENLKKLANFEEYSCLVFFLPFVLFTDVLQSACLSVNSRKQLCFVSYDIITLLYNESKNIQNVRSKNSQKVGYLRNSMRQRTQNTIIGFSYALEYYGSTIMTSRLGTHIVEFIFGHMRNGCNGYDILEKCVYQLAKSEITKEILERYHKDETPIAGRAHVGGSCFSPQWNIDIDENIDIDKVSKECVLLIHGKLIYNNSNIHKLINFLSENAPKVPEISGSISCAKIQARQVHYSKKH